MAKLKSIECVSDTQEQSIRSPVKQYYAGQSILITGVTGFIGKVSNKFDLQFQRNKLIKIISAK